MAAWSDLDITNASYWPLVGTQINTTGGGGSGAVVFAIVVGGVITSLNIISGAATSGSYTSNFSATITGGGTGASVTLTVSGGAITGYTSLVGGTNYKGTAPAWNLNSPANVWSALLASIATLRAPINGNLQTISNLGSLTIAAGGVLGVGSATGLVTLEVGASQPNIGWVASGGVATHKRGTLTYDGGGVITGGGWVFQAYTDAGVFSTNLVSIIQATGFVGIGTIAPTSPLHVMGLPSFASNSLALSGGLTAGAFYRNGDVVQVVH